LEDSQKDKGMFFSRKRLVLPKENRWDAATTRHGEPCA